MILRCLFVAGLVITTTLGAPAIAQDDGARVFKIYMVLWRGETDVEEGFASYLNERGINYELIIRNLDRDRSKLPGFVREIKRTKPDLVYTWGTSSTLGIVGPYDNRDLEKFVTDIPVVFTLVAYPIAAKIIDNDEQPGGNVTGVRFLASIDAQLAAIKRYRPFDTLGIIYNPTEKNSTYNIEELRDRADANGFKLLERPAPLDDANKPIGDAVPDLVRSLGRDGADWLYIGPDSFTAVEADRLTGTALEVGLPSFAATELPLRTSQAMIGLVSRYYTLGKLTASVAEKILIDGTAPADLPVARLSRYSLILNFPVVKALEFYPPMRVIAIADIIE